jgi:hypothetical protein
VKFQPARTQQSGVQTVKPVGRGEHHDALEVLDAVELGEQLRDDPFGDLTAAAAATAAARCQRIDLVEEDDAGSGLARLFKEFDRAQFHDADDRRQIGVAGHEDHGNCPCARSQPSQRLDTVRFRHPKIEDDTAGSSRIKIVNEHGRQRVSLGLQTNRPEQQLQQVPCALIIVDHMDNGVRCHKAATASPAMAVGQDFAPRPVRPACTRRWLLASARAL